MDVAELIELLSYQQRGFEVLVHLDADIGSVVDVMVDEQAGTITLIGGDLTC